MEATALTRSTGNDWFNLIFENKMTGIIIMSLDGQFLKVNQTYCKITGYSEEELAGMSFYDITPKEELEAYHQLIEKVKSGDTDSFEIEKQIITKGGSLKWVEIKTSVIESKSNQMLSFIADINDKKCTAEALKKSESELRLAQKVANIGSWYIDLQTHKIVWSDEMYSILEMDKKEEPLGWRVVDLVHPEDREIFKAKMGAFQDFDDLEVRRVGNGGTSTIRINARVLYEQNEPVKFYGTVQDITETRKMQNRIEEAQQIAKLGWWELDLASGNAVWSDSIYAIMEIKKGDKPLTFEQYKQILHPDDLKYMSMDLSQWKDGWHNAPLRYKKKDGGYKYVLTSGKVILENGRPVKIVGTNMDITETMEMQHKLREVQKIARVGWYEYDLVNPLNHKVSKELSDLLELPEPDGPLDANQYIMAMPPEDRQDFLYRINNIHEYPDGWENQVFRIVTQSGTTRYIAGSARIAYENSKPVRIFGTVYDVTKIKRYEQEIARNQIDFRTLITSMENIVFVINEQLKFEKVFCNDPELLHIPAKDFIGKSIHEIWTDEPGTSVAQMTEEAFNNGTEGSCTYKFAPRKKEYWWSAYVKSIKGEDNSTWVAVIINDVTTKKLAEEELIKSMQKEKDFSKMRAQFVSMASHQFRTPLTVIKSNMELLELAGIDHPVVSKVKHRLQVETDRLITLMDDVMTMGKVQTGNVEPELEPVDLPALVYRVKLMVENQFHDGRTVQVFTSGKEQPVQLDPKLMEHVLSNLLENAFKYSQGCPGPELHLEYSPEKLRISILDFGIGIPESDRTKLFSPFQRGSNIDQIPGTGLGLAVAKMFVELNNGLLFLNERHTNGTEFCIDLPLDK